MTSELSYSPSAASARRRGIFIAFEGGDGTGKSTQVRALVERLEKAGHEVVSTREPGGTQIGEKIRALLLEEGHGEVDARTEALMYAASRAAHAHQLIRPALERDAVVVCDRYIDSSAAYQGAGRGLGIASVTELSRWATEDLLPDVTVYLSLDLAGSRARLQDRGPADRLESEPDSFHEKVHQAFDLLAHSEGANRVTVDGSGTIEEVASRVWQAVSARVPSLADGPATHPAAGGEAR